MADPIMKRTVGDGVEIALAVWEGKGKTVFCVHGISASSRCWDNVAGALIPQHEVLAMDLRGRGLSEKPASGYSVSHHYNILLPEQALGKMLQEIPDARYVDIVGSNHYSIVMQPDKARDAAILDFLELGHG